MNNQASQEDKTVSAIINHVLRKYVTWDQFVSEMGFVFLQKSSVQTIFEHVSNEDIVKQPKPRAILECGMLLHLFMVKMTSILL